MDILIGGAGVIPQLFPTVCTVNEIAEDAFRSVFLLRRAALGLAYFRIMLRKNRNRELGQRIVVWIILLVLVLFASMMWVSRSTEEAANNAVQRIFEYHETHPTDDSDEKVKEERVAFLNEQAKQVSSTDTLYTVVSLGLFLIVMSMMLNNYRDTQKLGERLTAVRVNAPVGL